MYFVHSFRPASNNDVVKRFSAAMFRYCIIINLEKTEVMHMYRPPEGRAGHRARGDETDSGGQFRKPRRLGGAVCGDGKMERQGHRRVQAGANAWRAVEALRG